MPIIHTLFSSEKRSHTAYDPFPAKGREGMFSSRSLSGRRRPPKGVVCSSKNRFPKGESVSHLNSPNANNTNMPTTTADVPGELVSIFVKDSVEGGVVEAGVPSGLYAFGVAVH